MRNLYLKFTDTGGRGCVYDTLDYRHALPKGGKPGPVRAIEGEPKPCVRGFHAPKRRLKALTQWAEHSYARRLFVVELGGRKATEGDKVAYETCRFIREVKGWWGAVGRRWDEVDSREKRVALRKDTRAFLRKHRVGHLAGLK